jgi:hypothetical protein
VHDDDDDVGDDVGVDFAFRSEFKMETRPVKQHKPASARVLLQFSFGVWITH